MLLYIKSTLDSRFLISHWSAENVVKLLLLINVYKFLESKLIY